MKFITIEELDIRKQMNLVDDVSSEDYSIIEQLELMAIDEISSYISSRYDTDIIFKAEGDERSPMLRRIVSDMILCYLWERPNHSIPLYLVERCKANKEWLVNVQQGLLNPNLPKLNPDFTPTSSFRYTTKKTFANDYE